MKKYATCCGLYCGACSGMIVHEKNNKILETLKISIDYEETSCEGCGSEGLENCEFILCCKEHNVENCAFCSEFPCTMILKFRDDEWKHHVDVIDNLQAIREKGVDSWLEDQKKKWQCSCCGTRTHWYQTKCLNCGNKWDCKYQN